VTVTLPDHIVQVDQPLFLISQAQRSGGTLLLRLLDGHPECNVVPFQLRGLDEAAKRAPKNPEEAWQEFYDPKLARRYEAGHRQGKHDVLRDDETFSFELQPEVQRAIFDACVGHREPTLRSLFDCYFTSYFNAWLDYENLRTGEKRWVVGFEPGVARSPSRRTAVRNVYPDGRVVSIVRDPWSWYASARRWEPRWADREAALDHWCSVAGGTLNWRRKGKKRREVKIVTFEKLLVETEETMRRIASWIGVEFRPELTRPTFNGRPIKANTSFSDVQTEVSTAPLDRAQGELSAEEVDYIEARAGELYRTMLKKAENDWTKSVE
jgi:hypothetical protein